MEIRVVNHSVEVDPLQWERFVYNHPHGNFFQTPRVYKFLQGFPAYNPYFVSAWRGDELVGLFQAFRQKEGNGLKGYLSRRTIVYGGPLVKPGDRDGRTIVQRLIQTLNHTSDSLYTEFRNMCDASEYEDVFLQAGYVYQPHLNYIITIPGDEQAVLKLLHSSKRGQVRKSQRNGARTILPRGKDDVKQFYLILKRLYREKVKKPLPPWSFFERFHEDKELGVYLLILYQEKIIGGIMCPAYDKTLYEWYVCGEDGKYRNIYPSVLATYAPLLYGCQNGYRYFDFLGAGKPGEDYGVREFKSKFGGKQVEYGRFFRVNNPLLYSAGRIGYRLYRARIF